MSDREIVQVWQQNCPLHAWLWLRRQCGILDCRPVIYLFAGSAILAELEERIRV